LKQAERTISSAVVIMVQRQAVSQATLDTSPSTRDNEAGAICSRPGQHQDRPVNYGYTNGTAPLDGIVERAIWYFGRRMVGRRIAGRSCDMLLVRSTDLCATSTAMNRTCCGSG